MYGGGLRALTQIPHDPQRCTLRQTTECDSRTGGPSSAGGSVSQQFEMGVPLRETEGRAHHGGLVHTGAYAAPLDATGNTQRGQASMAPTGVRGVVGAPQTPHTFDMTTDRGSHGYTPGPGRMNHTADPSQQLPNFEATRVSNHYHDPRQGYVFQGDYATPGQVDISTQPVVENYGGPWGVQRPNDPNNPFVHDISNGATLPRHA